MKPNIVLVVGSGEMGKSLSGLVKDVHQPVIVVDAQEAKKNPFNPEPVFIINDYQKSKPANDKDDLVKRPQRTPPRSMTKEELEYYKKHKTLNGFVA